MSFVCPRCDNATLAIVESIELGPDDDNDERAVQRIRCATCQLTGAAMYTESRRGADSAWHHFGFELDAPGEDALRSWCAEPAEARRPIQNVHDLARPTSSFAMRSR